MEESLLLPALFHQQWRNWTMIAEHSLRQAEALQLHRLPLHEPLPQQRRENLTRHYFGPPHSPWHSRFAFVPLEKLMGLSQLLPGDYQFAAQCKKQPGNVWLQALPWWGHTTWGAWGAQPAAEAALPALRSTSATWLPWPPAQGEELDRIRTCSPARRGFLYLGNDWGNRVPQHFLYTPKTMAKMGGVGRGFTKAITKQVIRSPSNNQSRTCP